MGTATTRLSLSAAFLGMLANIDTVLFDTYRQEKAVHKQLFNINKTTLPIVRSESFSGLGLFQQKTEGEEGAIDEIRHMYPVSYTPLTWSLEVSFSREAIMDDLLGVVKKAEAGLASSAIATEDMLAANVLNNGFTVAGPDGSYLFATDHTILTGTTKNRPTIGTAFSRTALALALADWMNYQLNDNGMKIDGDPAYLIHPADLKLDVSEVLKSVERPDTANRAQNVIESDYNIMPVTWKRLSDPKTWFLFGKPGEHTVNVIQREAFTRFHGVDDRAGAAWTRGEFRVAYGYDTWRSTWGSPGQ